MIEYLQLLKEKNNYLIPLFCFGICVGFALSILFWPEIKTRQELCSQDIQEVELLRSTLKKQELLCIQKIENVSLEISQHQKKVCTEKLSRIKDACNDLDCAQCKR